MRCTVICPPDETISAFSSSVADVSVAPAGIVDRSNCTRLRSSLRTRRITSPPWLRVPPPSDFTYASRPPATPGCSTVVPEGLTPHSHA